MNKILQGIRSSKNRRLTDFENLSVVLLFSILCIFGTGCKASKKAQNVQLKERSEKFLLKKLKGQHIEAEWWTAKARIAFKGDQNIKATSYIRMRKDSVIWMNVKKLGVEAARILITTDSVYIMDRIHKQYLISDFSYIERKYHLPADFSTLQNLILGNPVFITESDFTTRIDQDQYHLASTNEETFTSDYWINGLDYTLAKMLFMDYRNNQKVEVTQSKYESLESYQNFSYLRSIDLSSPNTGDVQIELKLSDVTLNSPKSIKFEIPEHYTKID